MKKYTDFSFKKTSKRDLAEEGVNTKAVMERYEVSVTDRTYEMSVQSGTAVSSGVCSVSDYLKPNSVMRTRKI